MWSEDELRHVALGDKRLDRRLVRMVYDLASQPMASVPHASGTWGATKAAYRFWANGRVTAAAIRLGHSKRAEERVREYDTVLAIQDTTDLDFTSHRSLEERGPLSFAAYQGLRVHSVLAASSEVEEVDPPQGVEPICWYLLTTLTISTQAEAIQAVRWYSFRWLIERYHFVLKSGCRIEALQLQTTAQIEKALATYAIVAWRLMWLLYQARQAPATPATDVLDDVECRALYAKIHRTSRPPRHLLSTKPSAGLPSWAAS